MQSLFEDYKVTPYHMDAHIGTQPITTEAGRPVNQKMAHDSIMITRKVTSHHS